MANIDLLITGAQVVDGTGNPWFYGDIAITGQHITDVTPPGKIDPSYADNVVDGSGKVVCPGFIDIQSHSILPLMVDGRCLSKIAQGVTTEIMGEGWTPAPFGGKIENIVSKSPIAELIPEWMAQFPTWPRFRNWLDAVLKHGVTPNIGSFLGGGTLRMYAKGMEMGDATEDERATMRRVMAEAMEDGAFGVSYALIYPPAAYVDTDEVVDVCKVVSDYNGLYITHIRSEADQLIEGMEEALDIGRRANLPVEIYHLKAAGQRNWHKMEQVIQMIETARAQGLDVTADMYPYIAAGTGLSAVLPPWAAAEGKFFENLADPAMRAKIRAEVLQPSGDWEAMADLCGPASVMPIGFAKPENQPYVGKTLVEIAEMRNQDWIESVFDLFISEEQRVSAIYFLMSEENVQRQLQLPWNKISTDAGGFDPAWAKALGPYHPRAYGTYTRVLGKYVRDEKVLPLEDAIRKMSSSVADRLGLRTRGRLAKGCHADVVIFDPATIGDRATFADPHHLSVGVQHVWVNGVQVFKDGTHTEAKPGQIVEGIGR